MSVLTASQSAFIRLVSRRPATIFSSQESMEVEFSDLASEVATDIAKSHDWQALTGIETITGDGTATAFPLPADYDRMALGQGVHDGQTWFWNYTRVMDLDEWITITTSGFFGLTPGWWIILEGQIQFYPAPALDATAKYPYIKKTYARSEAGVAQSSFLTDNDTFVLDERLLTLGLIWRWKSQKGLEYAEDMATFEEALSQDQARDKGSRVIRKGGWQSNLSGMNRNIAWPWPLGGVP